MLNRRTQSNREIFERPQGVSNLIITTTQSPTYHFNHQIHTHTQIQISSLKWMRFRLLSVRCHLYRALIKWSWRGFNLWLTSGPMHIFEFEIETHFAVWWRFNSLIILRPSFVDRSKMETHKHLYKYNIQRHNTYYSICTIKLTCANNIFDKLKFSLIIYLLIICIINGNRFWIITQLITITIQMQTI